MSNQQHVFTVKSSDINILLGRNKWLWPRLFITDFLIKGSWFANVASWYLVILWVVFVLEQVVAMLAWVTTP